MVWERGRNGLILIRRPFAKISSPSSKFIYRRIAFGEVPIVFHFLQTQHRLTDNKVVVREVTRPVLLIDAATFHWANRVIHFLQAIRHNPDAPVLIWRADPSMVPVSHKQDRTFIQPLKLIHQPIKLFFSFFEVLQRPDANAHDNKIPVPNLKLNKSVFRNQLVFVAIRIGKENSNFDSAIKLTLTAIKTSLPRRLSDRKQAKPRA